ncbi:MAG: hypothetical protein DWQ47_16940 [Acidobacteria bacterium]|nr:MAG: hypothetical protein DWQ32_04340 [Acidobacteriota bacterium]REK02270.1 MAG: hypothetical protein DWQ38_07810 [Acidobacteriota bacterium]REK13927.1 MAG: hypothetical protein DWQ43_10030 [Acidobacteriota bacterium]REK41921.1 MAG: hypothetical protein DWQ47_16940 [Acidobacteriota bacterium]
MNTIKKVIAAVLLGAVISVSSVSASTGVIVNLSGQDAETQCVETKPGTTDELKGVIVNLTGVIVNFTGVIVNVTGVIVNLAEGKSEICGHLPTGDK